MSSKVNGNNSVNHNKNTLEVESKVYFVNTGNWDARLIKCGDKSILIDGGDNNDEKLVSSYLKNQGVKRK